MDVGTAVEPRRLPGVGRPPYLVRILDEVFEALLVEIAQFHGLRQHSAGDQRRHEVDGLAPDDGAVVLDVRRQLDVVLVLPEDKVLSSTPTRSRCRSSTAEVEVRLEDDGVGIVVDTAVFAAFDTGHRRRLFHGIGREFVHDV